jgi:hypothetical protein
VQVVEMQHAQADGPVDAHLTRPTGPTPCAPGARR